MPNIVHRDLLHRNGSLEFPCAHLPLRTYLLRGLRGFPPLFLRLCKDKLSGIAYFLPSKEKHYMPPHDDSPG